MKISALETKRHRLRAHANTLVWTQLMHLLLKRLWSHVNLKTIIFKNHCTEMLSKLSEQGSYAFLWPLPLTFELWPTLRLLPLLQEGDITFATHEYVSPFYFSITLQKEKREVPQDSDRSIKKRTLKLAIINLTQTASAAIPYDRAHSNNTCSQVRVLCAAFGIHQGNCDHQKCKPMIWQQIQEKSKEEGRTGSNSKWVSLSKLSLSLYFILVR